MIELVHDLLQISFPEVHQEARMAIELVRTLRVPDDGKEYPLPPGFGPFPMRHVDDFARFVPDRWVAHGGVMTPIHQSEALWLRFLQPPGSTSGYPYPFAVQVAAGKVCAITGEPWSSTLHRYIDPGSQNYVVFPGQRWLDGYKVTEGQVRQFVAAPLDSVYTAERQITNESHVGGIQIQVFPMKADEYERRRPAPVERLSSRMFFQSSIEKTQSFLEYMDMGVAPGGRVRQHVLRDEYASGVWASGSSSRVFIHLANSRMWEQITGLIAPHPPLTAAEYTTAGYPWFDLYEEDIPAVPGSTKLNTLKSLADYSASIGENVLPENESVQPETIEILRRGLSERQVREF